MACSLGSGGSRKQRLNPHRNEQRASKRAARRPARCQCRGYRAAALPQTRAVLQRGATVTAVEERGGLAAQGAGHTTAAQFGDFSPVAGITPPRNAFMRLDQLQEAAGLDRSRKFVLQAGTRRRACPACSMKARLQASGVDCEAGLWSSEMAFTTERSVTCRRK